MGKDKRHLDSRVGDMTNTASINNALLNEGKKAVLLVTLDNNISASAINYAMNLAKRVDAGVEILNVSATKAKTSEMDKLRNHLDEGSIGWSYVQKAGCPKELILKLTSSRSGIVAVVVESNEKLEKDCRAFGRTLTRAWRNISCPLVFVSDANPV